MSRALRPGFPVVRRDDGHLQVGVDPPHRAVLADSPEVRRALASLTGSRPAADGSAGRGGCADRVLTALEAVGLLVEPSSRPPSPAAEAARARHGRDAERRLSARESARVSLDAPTDAGEELARLLADAGVRVDRGRCSDKADLHVVVGHGPVPRARLDPCLQAGTPYLVVAGGAGRYVVGPFVLPGRTGCLRCDDAARGEADPRRALVLEQLTRVPPLAPDPVLLALALAWAARDVLAWLEGEEPSTWGATFDLGAGPLPVREPVARHPHCGCSWAQWPAG